MHEIDYRLGESGTLGFPIDQPDGTPMPLGGLGLRMRVNADGTLVTLAGYSTSGELLIDGRELTHPSMMAFDIGPADLEIGPGRYPAVLEVNDGSGWRALPGGDFTLHVRRF